MDENQSESTTNFEYVSDDGNTEGYEPYLIYGDGVSSNQQIFESGNLLMFVSLGLLTMLLLSLCWSYCANDDKDSSYFECEDTSQKIIAREVRPGLIVVQNCKDAEETFRIIQEYDAMHSGKGMHQFPQYGGIAQASNTTASYVQASSAPYYGPYGGAQVPHYGGAGLPHTSNHIPTQNLIDMEVDNSGRPPPYAPTITPTHPAPPLNRNQDE